MAAAAALETSAAAGSCHVAAPKTHLSARLLHPTHHRLAMTSAGQDHYVQSRLILADVSVADVQTSQTTGKPSAVLHVTSPSSYGLCRLSNPLPGFMTLYPDPRLDIDPDVAPKFYPT